jgi:hypothetical protein
MQWTEIKRGLSVLLGGSALLLAAACGGGGDHSPTGPTNGGNTLQFSLVSLGQDRLPAQTEVENCTLTRFNSGGLTVNRDGTWKLKLKIWDDNLGDWAYADNGTYEEVGDGETVWFRSDITDMNFHGAVNGPEVVMDYDWCEDGVPDVQLVFNQ